MYRASSVCTCLDASVHVKQTDLNLNFLFLLQVLRLQEEKTLLKQISEEEVGQLWSQLESMRTSRQELGGELVKPAWHVLVSPLFQSAALIRVCITNTLDAERCSEHA